jgi:uridylate kinase
MAGVRSVKAERAAGKETVVVSIGGSVLLPGKPDPSFIKRLVQVLVPASTRVRLFVVVGGGWIARFYKDIGKELGCDDAKLDENGITITRLNAGLLIAALGPAASPVQQLTANAAVAESVKGKIVVMGGERPGQTTDAVAASIAAQTRAARLVNATNVDGVYDSDPRKNKGAVRFDRLTFKEFLRICGKAEHKPGMHVPFDPAGARLVARARIKTLILDGRDLGTLQLAILGKKARATVVEG